MARESRVNTPIPSPAASQPGSQPGSPKVNPAVPPVPTPAPIPMDTSIQAWILNIQQVLHFPSTIIGIAGLLVAGAFAETAPRKSFEFLDNYIGRAIFFILPIIITLIFDWPTGLLGATVSLIFFARLQKEGAEGFVYTREKDIDLIPTSNRWLSEKILGESPIAISSDRIRGRRTIDEDTRTSSSSSMSTSHNTSDGSSHK
jgi:hypothetical protein